LRERKGRRGILHYAAAPDAAFPENLQTRRLNGEYVGPCDAPGSAAHYNVTAEAFCRRSKRLHG